MKTAPFTKTYPDGFSLQAPALELRPGRICAVIGGNGSGKSTFAKVLAGVLTADSSASPLPAGPTVRYMPQHSYPFRMSLLSNLTLGGGDPARARQLMESLQISHLSTRRADRLSGGECSRMALARVLMRPCDLLILDEPTAAMDMESTVLAERLLAQTCREQNCALVLVTHSLQQARRLADDILFFHHGTLAEQGPASQVLSTPAQTQTKQFLAFYGG